MPTYTRPETIVTGLIDAATSLTVGTNLFSGPPRPALPSNSIPRNAVFCHGMFSFLPRQYLGTGKDYRKFRITVTVRQTQDEFETGQTLARDIWKALHRADITANAGYVSCLMAESDVIYMGLSDTDDHRWFMTAILGYVGTGQ